MLLLFGNAAAHDGHDHGPPAPPLPSTVKPRVAMQTDVYELVAIAVGEQLTIFLDRYDNNEPVVDATITVLAGAVSAGAERRPDGSYRVRIPDLAKAGRHELVFNIAHRLGDDLLAGAVELGADGGAAPRAAASTPAGSAGEAAAARASPASLVAIALAILTALAVGYAIGSRRARGIGLVAVIALSAGPPPTGAHEGHEPSPAPAGETLSGDVPRRLPDASVFLPKPSQRLLSVRSQIAVEGEANRTATLVGRIISDPNRSGVVQSINGGRVQPLAEGLPRLGQPVKRGDPLVAIVPALPLADQSTLAEKQRELEGAASLARQKLARLSRLGGSITPRSQIEDIELEITNLEHRLASLKQAKVQPEVLAAPIDGVVSASRVVAGQVVQAQDILIQIVDPASLWVEALVFDQIAPGAIVAASAVTPDGAAMKLAYRGRGRALQAQAVQIHFAIDKPPAGAVLGLPVTVLARNAETVKGMLLPRDAVVRGAAGETIVWQHLDPERFVARQVRVEPFDGERVLVTGGIAPKDRIVVHGAELLSQVR